MKTDDLIALLANGASSELRSVPARRFSVALGAALPAAIATMALLLHVNPAWQSAVAEPRTWLKLGYVAAVAATSWAMVMRLSRPAGRATPLLAALALPVGVMAAIAAGVLLSAEEGSRVDLVLGRTWTVCAALIAMLSAPLLAATLLAMRGLAPIHLAGAGAAAGLLSGAVGALVYCVHCPEVDPPFVLVWYTAGMAIPAGVGALLGPRVLRW